MDISRVDNNFDSKNFSGINLRGVNLTDASFIGTNLSNADLSEANLSKASFIGADLREANLSNAILTGACIQDWNINSKTILDGVICDYIFLEENEQERRPSDPYRNFAPGEFAKLVQESEKTVDLIFQKGVDWRAFAYSIQNTQVLNEDTPLAIQSIEDRGDGVVLIKVKVPQNADKGKIDGDFWKGYESAQKHLEARHESEIKRMEVRHESEINRLINIVPKITITGPVGNVAGEVKGDLKTIQKNLE